MHNSHYKVICQEYSMDEGGHHSSWIKETAQCCGKSWSEVSRAGKVWGSYIKCVDVFVYLSNRLTRSEHGR